MLWPMLKAANVQFMGWDKVGSGLVSAFVTGDVAGATSAVIRLTVNDTRFDATDNVVIAVQPLTDSRTEVAVHHVSQGFAS
jgi:ethanolamine utilization protein EutM